MMKRTLTILSILLLSSFLSAAQTTVSTITKKISAYKYGVSDPFAEKQDPELQFRLLDANNTEKTGTLFLLDATDVDKNVLLCYYVISGNMQTCSLSIGFTPLQVKDSQNNVEYTITVIPGKTKINNIQLPYAVEHEDSNGANHSFAYTTTEPESQSITITNHETNSIVYSNLNIGCEITPSLSGYPKNGVIDHWIREGAIKISIPSTKSNGSDNFTDGTYESTMTFTFEGS
jgi:predicted small secreted protein